MIISIFLFFNIDSNLQNDFLFQIKFLSENSIRILLMVLMSICLVIPPIRNQTIIIWNKIGLFNFVRAIIFLIGCAFLPGSNLYSLFFARSKLHERFGVESFLLKITLYPLLSFTFIGSSVLILDQLGLAGVYIEQVLFLQILSLFTLDLIFQKVKKEFQPIKPQTINISRYTYIILIISLGILLIALGIHLGIYYNVPGDSWIGLAPANYIGTSNGTPIDWGRTWAHYPIFWSYISYGLSKLSGLPYFNTNALLTPFCYLFITTVYLMMKVILHEFKEWYACFSTILLAIFSTLFYISIDYGHGDAPGFIFDCEFLFFYKSFSYILLFFSIALFKVKIISKVEEDLNNERIIKFKEANYLILIGVFLVICYALYVIPLIMGIIIMILYFSSSKEKMKFIKILLQILFYFNLAFIIFDIIMSFYLSESSFWIINFFFGIKAINQILEIIPYYVLLYGLLWGIFLIIYFVQLVHHVYFLEQEKEILHLNLNIKKIFKLFLIIFTILLGIEISVIILEEYFLKYKLDNKFIFFYLLDIVFLNIGFIGISAIYLSYYSYRQNKNLFQFLILWIIVSFLLGSIMIIINVINTFSIMMNSIDKQNLKTMEFWYNRLWIYSIIPLCILCAIGIKQLAEHIKLNSRFNKLFNTSRKRELLKFTSLSFLIFLTYSNLIMAGIWTGNINNRPKEEEIELLSWMSENIPEDSNILIDEEYIIRVGIFSMVNGRYYFINDYFDKDNNQTENIEEIDDLKDDEIEYLLIHEDNLYGSSNRSKFIRSYLVPFFYNDSKHKTDHYRLYYAPYFD